MSTENKHENQAKELVEKFIPLVRRPRFGKRHTDPDYLAKEAAIICVEEILIALKFVNDSEYYRQWIEVKQSIQKL